MNIWGFIFVVVAAIIFTIEAVTTRALVAAGLAALSIGFLLTYVASGTVVHL